MRIAIVSDWFTPRRGGIEGQLAQLAQRLVEHGHAVDVLTSTPDASAAPGVRVRPLGVFTLPGVQLTLSPSLPRVLRQELRRGYDVVHAHVSVVSPVGYVAAAAARSLGLPTVVTFHSVLRHKRHLLRIANALAGLGRSAVTWSAVSELVASQVRDAISDAQVSVLSNGIDLSAWADQGGSATRRDAEPVVTLVSTMRLHRKKRPLALLHAFAAAASRAKTRARLMIVGDGPERSAIERQIRDLGLTTDVASVQLLGWRSPDELRALYGHSDGFVLPSTREAFGIAALEARAAGLPVIAMAASGAVEFLVQDANALLCDDDGELTASLARFLGDRGLRNRLANARMPLGRYDWTAVIAEHQRVYDRAITRAVAAELVVA